jgi:hypothetical protein
MSAIKMTLEITSTAHAVALAEALQCYLDCNTERVNEEVRDYAEARAKGETVDWRDERETKQLRAHVKACQELLKAIE